MSNEVILVFFWVQMILIIGMKLQQIITDLALEVRGGVQKIETTLDDLDGHIVDTPKKEFILQPIKARDDLFWFHRPRFLLYLVHFILFQVRLHPNCDYACGAVVSIQQTAAIAYYL